MPILEELFTGPALDARLVWWNPPPQFSLGAQGLRIETAAQTDFWQRTHYGFRADNGHALLMSVTEDFRVETEVTFEPVHQYDQAGLFVRVSAESWLKTSIEFELDAPSRLGSVVTNHGWSDWATEDVPATLRHARYRISRSSGDYTIEHAGDDAVWRQLRVAHLHADDGHAPIHVGVYACSPKGSGFSATFQLLRVEGISTRSQKS